MNVLSNAQPEAIDLLYKMLMMNPKHRLTALQCLQHPYFEECRLNDEEHFDTAYYNSVPNTYFNPVHDHRRHFREKIDKLGKDYGRVYRHFMP